MKSIRVYIIFLVLLITTGYQSDQSFLYEVESPKEKNKELQLAVQKQVNDMHYL